MNALPGSSRRLSAASNLGQRSLHNLACPCYEFAAQSFTGAATRRVRAADKMRHQSTGNITAQPVQQATRRDAVPMEMEKLGFLLSSDGHPTHGLQQLKTAVGICPYSAGDQNQISHIGGTAPSAAIGLCRLGGPAPARGRLGFKA